MGSGVVAISSDSAHWMQWMVRYQWGRSSTHYSHQGYTPLDSCSGQKCDHVRMRKRLSTSCFEVWCPFQAQQLAVPVLSGVMHCQWHLTVWHKKIIIIIILKKAPAISPQWWYSFYRSLKITLEMWDWLTAFAETQSGGNTKVQKLRVLLSGKKQGLYE